MANQSVLMGGNPTHYDPSNPIVIFLVQATIVIVFCRILHLPLSRIRQPRVIAEVIGGILLGPTAFGRIPGFTNSIFPNDSMPNFNLVANVGLILFLFIVGLEVDMRLVVKNARVALSVGIASLVLPFATGCFIAWLLHREYADTLEKDDFGVFLLFIGTAFSITAFPVLARILTELKLLRVNVGVTVLAAGVGNDVTGWMLLALTIALVNASSGLIALYVILLVLAWVLILFFLVKPAYAWLLRRSSSDSAPSDTMMTLTILLVLVSAFYTEIIGVHPIFGAFLVGMIIPHDNGYAVSLTEKIEDLVSVLFLPLYFASSGLKTDIGLLNDGKAWGYTILIIIMATASKVVGSMLAARVNGFLWRESLVVGVLMSCKGLVELIVLNVGLNSGILSQKVFTMFVIMALVTTFLTTPLTIWLFPTAFQEKVARWRDGEIDWNGNELSPTPALESEVAKHSIDKIVVVVSRIEGVARLLHFTHFFSPKAARLHLVRLLEITDRLSQIIKVSEADDLINSDSLISIFKTNARLIGMRLSYALQIVVLGDFASILAKESDEQKADLVVAPWVQDGEESHGNDYILTLLESRTTNLAVLLDDCPSTEPEHALRGRTTSLGSLRSMMRTTARPISRRAPTARLEKPLEAERAHFYFPLFQFGQDEALAMQLLSSLAQSNRVSVHVVFFKKRGETSLSTVTSEESKPSRTPLATEMSPAVFELSGSRSHSRPATAMPTPAELDADVAACQASLPVSVGEHGPPTTCANVQFEVIECSDVLETALRKSTTEARSGPLTVVVAHRAGPLVRVCARELEKTSGLLSGYNASNGARGELTEVFAAYTERVGRLCVVSAKAAPETRHDKTQ